jgi:ABC-2 type transport system permease protein
MLRAQLRAQMSYRASFVIEFIGSAAVTGLDLLTVIVLFGVTKTLGGFGFGSAFLMATLAGLGFACADLVVGNIDNLREGIRTGQLDALLVRPLGLLRQLLATDFELRRVGRAIQSLVALVVATLIAHLDWSAETVLLLIVTPLAGAVFFASVFVIGGTVAFWWIDSGEFANGFTYGGRDFTTYPVTVYGDVFRRLFAYGLGFAFVAYYPALVLTHERDPLGHPAWLGWLSPLVAAAMAGLASVIWRSGIRHYRSTGS